MRAFEFPLSRALAWRMTQREIEEHKLRQLAAAIEEVELATVRLGMLFDRTEQTVRESSAIASFDLWAHGAYRLRLKTERETLQARRKELEQHVTEQRQRVVEAQRQCRLLEKLEHRRRAEWQVEADRELDNLAAESFLARWTRRGP